MNQFSESDAIMTNGFIESYPRHPLQEYVYPDKLPLTPISKNAALLLRSFSIPEHFYTGLRNLTSEFRYDLCLDRCNRIVNNPAYYMEFPDGSAQVILQHAEKFDSTVDGQCSNLAMKWIRSIHTTGWLEDVNAYLRHIHKPPVHPVFLQGYANTHFTHEKDNHVWVGLTTNPDFIDPEKLLLIDPAFQLISTYMESSYRLREVDVYIDPPSFNQSTSRIIDVGELDLLRRTSTGTLAVLGISADRTVSFSMGFCYLKYAPQNRENIFPYIYITHANRSMSPFVYLNKHVYFDPLFPVSDSVQAEALDIFKTLYTIHLQVDDYAASHAYHERGDITW